MIDLDVEFTPHLGRDGVAQYEIVDGDWPGCGLIAREGGRARPTHATSIVSSGSQLQQLCAKALFEKGFGPQTAIVIIAVSFAPYAICRRSSAESLLTIVLC